jgi:hypothetical protein
MNGGELIEIIETAFGDVGQPGEITLHVAEAHDSRDYDNDLLHRKKDHLGRWQDIPEEHIERCQNALSHVGKTSLLYYLPAYMIWHLRRRDQRPVDHTFFALDRGTSSSAMIAHQKEKYSLFTAAQLSVVAAYLKYCSDELSNSGNARYAARIYESYWQRHT